MARSISGTPWYCCCRGTMFEGMRFFSPAYMSSASVSYKLIDGSVSRCRHVKKTFLLDSVALEHIYISLHSLLICNPAEWIKHENIKEVEDMNERTFKITRSYLVKLMSIVSKTDLLQSKQLHT